MKKVRICLIGDFNEKVTAHRAIPLALELARQKAGCEIETVWIGTAQCEAAVLDSFHAFWCVPASPYESMTGALRAIRFARESHRPFLGTCGGFQHALIEYARNVCELREADHEEMNPASSSLLISRLACSLVETSGPVLFAKGSRIGKIYGNESAVETYHCNFGLNPLFESRLSSQGLEFTARDSEGDVRAFELKPHPFYIGTLFQPERSALLGRVHPLILAYLQAAADSIDSAKP
jgi:CTP synthase (UTP-ammonia lyase)